MKSWPRIFEKMLWVGWLAIAAGCTQAPPPPAVPDSSLDSALRQNIQRLREAVLTSPGSADAWGKLGQAFQAAELPHEARLCYTNALQHDERSARWHHLLALLQLPDWPETALKNLARAGELDGSGADASQVRLLQALVERGRSADAEKVLSSLLHLHPDHPAARLEQARLNLVRQELARSEAALQPCLTNPYTARPALLLLAQIRQRQGALEEATELVRQGSAMAKPPGWPDPFLREVQALGMHRQKEADHINDLLQQQRWTEADAALRQLLEQYPGDSEGLLLLGRLRYLRRDCVGAEEALRRHLANETNSLNGLIQLSLAQLCQQQWSLASETLRRALVLKPDFAQAHFNLGLALSRSGDYPAAIASFREAIRCSPDASSHTALADELLRLGQTAEATVELKRALALDPNHPRARRLWEQLPPGR